MSIRWVSERYEMKGLTQLFSDRRKAVNESIQDFLTNPYIGFSASPKERNSFYSKPLWIHETCFG
jgi:hypothetical protein